MRLADVCFGKTRGLAVLAIVRSQWVDDKCGVSVRDRDGDFALEGVFDSRACVWKGAWGFHAYVRTAILAANLLLLARPSAATSFRLLTAPARRRVKLCFAMCVAQTVISSAFRRDLAVPRHSAPPHLLSSAGSRSVTSKNVVSGRTLTNTSEAWYSAQRLSPTASRRPFACVHCD